HQALHVHRDVAPQVTLDLQLTLDHVAHARGLRFVPRLHPLVRVHAGFAQDADRRRPADAVDVLQRHLAPLLSRKIHARHSCHRSLLALSLLVTRVLADDADHAVAPHDLAVLAARLHARSHFHRAFVLAYLNRYVIRPRVRSYGDSSTFT